MSSTTPSQTPPPARPKSRRPDLDSLYCINDDGSRNEIHPADVRGRYQTRKKLLWAVMIGIYVVLPWIEVGGHPAILIDIARRQFFLLGNTFNAQDFYLAFFILSGLGFVLIVLSALYGRVWCGYGCPHTVFLEGVYRRVERFFDGNAQRRQRLRDAPWTAEKIVRRAGKWVVYLGISLGLSHTFLSYFMPATEVWLAVTNPPAEHPVAFTFVMVFTAIIYFNFTWFREQLCIVICPYGRLQGVLYDPDTINVGYDARRGEPRGKHNQADRGDCIDCYRCVAVCPTGIDIRNGTQLECVGCANCIDACDEVMAKVGQAPGLVRYDSQRGFDTGLRRLWRPRLLVYAVLFVIGCAVFAVAAWRRTDFEAKLIRLQGSPYTIDGDDVTNSFFLHLVNKSPAARTFRLVPASIPELAWTIPLREVTLESMADQRIPIFVRFPRRLLGSRGELVLGVATDAGIRDLSLKLLGPGAGR